VECREFPVVGPSRDVLAGPAGPSRSCPRCDPPTDRRPPSAPRVSASGTTLPTPVTLSPGPRDPGVFFVCFGASQFQLHPSPRDLRVVESVEIGVLIVSGADSGKGEMRGGARALGRGGRSEPGFRRAWKSRDRS
jgi:hypothetical protein